jgi:hypothetical protein
MSEFEENVRVEDLLEINHGGSIKEPESFDIGASLITLEFLLKDFVSKPAFHEGVPTSTTAMQLNLSLARS